MSMNKRLSALVAVLTVAILLLGACAPMPPTGPGQAVEEGVATVDVDTD